jgi:phage terminase large subunit
MKQTHEAVTKIIGGGYDDFWHFKGRYRVVKGGRASKKSKTTALWFIYHMMMYPQANLLVVRKTYNSLKNSCFSELLWAIRQFNADGKWTHKISPLEISYLNGGKIFFKGLDDPMKLTSITADTGKLCWVWLEETLEIDSENDFNMIDESIRGAVDGGLFKQLTLTFNPWNDGHWLKRRFFEQKDDNTMTFTTNYMGNEYLDASDTYLFKKMMAKNPKRYKVAGLGDWGIAEGLVYENWESRAFNTKELVKTQKMKTAFGLDFGYTNDPSALCCILINLNERIIYVFDEMYKFGLSNRDIFEQIRDMGYRKERIFADSNEPKSIDELYALGLTGIRKAAKGKDSVNYGIQFVQGFKIIVHPKCTNFLKEINSYSWQKNALGNKTNIPANGFDHLMDAMRYALCEISGGERWGF